MNSEPMAGLPELLTPREACDRLRVSKSTLDRWAREGLLNPVRLGCATRRFRATEVESLIQRGETAPRFSRKGVQG